MTSEQEQIKISYETLKMTPLEIAEDRNLQPEAVKAALMNCSAKYRKDCGEVESEASGEVDDGLNFTDEQLKRVNEKMYSIAVGSDNDAVALSACKYIREDKKGRLDVVKQFGNGLQFNVLQFNQMIKQADDVVKKALTNVTPKELQQ